MNPQYPDFLVRCGHGIDGGPLDDVALLKWSENQGVWEAPEPMPAVVATYLEGDRVGWFHRDGVMGDGSYKSLGPSRVQYEIICPRKEFDCKRRSLRIPDDDLQMVLNLIAANRKFRELAVGIDLRTLAVTLDGLHAARDMAANYRLVGRLRS